MSRRTIAIIASLTVLPFAFEGPVAVAGTPEIFKDALSWLSYADFWLLNAGMHPSALAVGATILLVGWLIPDVWGLFFNSNRNKKRTVYVQIAALLRRARAAVNSKRVERLWRHRELDNSRIRLSHGSRIRLWSVYPNHIWSSDLPQQLTRPKSPS